MKDFDIWDIEFMAANFQPLAIGDDFLDTRYEWQRSGNGVEWPYYRFFYHLAKTLQPALIVELGGWRGTAAAHFAAGYPGGKVITVDHHTDSGDEHNQAQMVEAANRYGNITYIQGWTNNIAAIREAGRHSLGDAPSAFQTIKKLTQSIDILFIDSWHTYTNARLDWDYYYPLLSSPALVICDDIQDGGDEFSPISGMLRFWQELPEPKFLNAKLHPGTNMGFIKV